MVKLLTYIGLGISAYMVFVLAAGYAPIVFPIAAFIITWFLMKRAGKDPVELVKEIGASISARAEAPKSTPKPAATQKSKPAFAAQKTNQKRLERK